MACMLSSWELALIVPKGIVKVAKGEKQLIVLPVVMPMCHNSDQNSKAFLKVQ